MPAMKTNTFGKSLVILAACALSLPLVALAQPVTVFSDNFSGASTIQSATPGAGTAIMLVSGTPTGSHASVAPARLRQVAM